MINIGNPKKLIHWVMNIVSVNRRRRSLGVNICGSKYLQCHRIIHCANLTRAVEVKAMTDIQHIVYEALIHNIAYQRVWSLMLWSQIKLTSYDFSDLHITGEFDNRPAL